MNKKLTGNQAFLLVTVFLVGALVGLGMVEHLWRVRHDFIHMWGLFPTRGWEYLCMALICSSSMGTLGLALVGHCIVPAEIREGESNVESDDGHA